VVNFFRKKKKQEKLTRFPSKNSNLKINKKFIEQENKISLMNLEKIAKKIEHEPALIRIGKNGLTDPIITEIRKLIPLKKALKIKILQNAPIENQKLFFDDLENKIGYKLWRTKGNTGIFIFKKIKTNIQQNDNS